MTDLSIQPWSAVWRIPTADGDVLLKQSIAARATEGSVHAFCADVAPDHVDPPLALDESSGRVLFADGGPVMSETCSDTPAGIAAMVGEYAQLQQATIGHDDRAEAAGLPGWDPAAAGREAESQAAVLHALPPSDPRHMTTAQKAQLLAGLDVFHTSGTALAQSPIPYTVEHGDLWAGNVLVPQGPSGRYRFIDFGDAAWTHPFISLMPLLFGCHHRWLPRPSPFDPNHPALQLLIETYLRHWTEYADLPELTETLHHALRVAPLRRSRALITNMDRATSEDVDELGPLPWAWLQTAISPPAS